MRFHILAKRALALSLAVTATSAAAQTGRPQAPGSGTQNRQGARSQPRQQKKNYLVELRAVTERLATAEKVKIVVDPALFVASAPKDPSDGLDLSQALDIVVGGVKGAAWKKVYLPSSAASSLPAPEKLAASVRALDSLEQTALVLENPVTKKATTFLKNYTISPTFGDELQSGQFSPTPVYVVYAVSPSADAKSMAERLADLQRQQMEMMMSMSPEEMGEAMQYGMQQFMNMDPQMRNQMMGTMMRSGMQMFMNMPADQRNLMIQDMGQMFQGLGGLGGSPPGRRP